MLEYCVNGQIIQAVRCAPREGRHFGRELTEVDTQNMRINEWIAEHMGLIRLSCSTLSSLYTYLTRLSGLYGSISPCLECVVVAFFLQPGPSLPYQHLGKTYEFILIGGASVGVGLVLARLDVHLARRLLQQALADVDEAVQVLHGGHVNG